MNEQTEKLIRELADRLGTTAEHLWGVLIRQAGISGITNLLVCAAWGALLAWGYRFLRRKTTAPLATALNPHPRAEWDDQDWIWLVFGFVVAVVALVVGCNLEQIVGSLLNPEYWALQQLLPQL